MARTPKTGKLLEVRQPHLILITGLPLTSRLITPDLTVASASGPATGTSPSASDFLALPGERFVFDSNGDSTQLQALLDSLEQRNRDHRHV